MEMHYTAAGLRGGEIISLGWGERVEKEGEESDQVRRTNGEEGKTVGGETKVGERGSLP
jgi:hypothetical protein